MERDTVEPTAGHIILSGPDASEQQQNIDHRWSLWGRCWRRRKKNSDRRQSDWWNISAVSNKKMSSVATANFPLDASKSSAHRQTVVYRVIIVKIERGITAVSNRLTELPICQRVPAQKYFIRKYLKKKKNSYGTDNVEKQKEKRPQTAVLLKNIKIRRAPKWNSFLSFRVEHLEVSGFAQGPHTCKSFGREFKQSKKAISNI